MAAYATAVQLLARYDSRRIAELNSDTGSPVTPVDPVSVSTPVGAALLDASAMLDSALQAGKRYPRDVLDTLVADADPSKGAAIVRVVCDLAVGLLVARRGLPAEELKSLAPNYDESKEWLGKLRDGQHVLDWDDAIQAGLPSAQLTDYWNPNLTSNWNGMFGLFGPQRFWIR